MARIPHLVQLHLEYRKGSVNGNADFFSRPPLPATELDRSDLSSLTPSDQGHIFLIRSYGLILGRSSALRVGLGGLAASDPSSGLGGLPISPHDFHGFHQHRPRMRVDDLDASSEEFVARAPLQTHVPAITSPFPCLQSLFHLCQLPPMARTSANTPFPPSFRLYYMTTMHRKLVR